MIVSLRHFFGWMVSAFSSREDLVLENLALRQQLLALHAKRPRRRLPALHKLFWVSFVLDLGLKSQTSRRTQVRQQRGSRPDLPYGGRESDLGSAAHSRRTAQAGFRSCGKECLAMGPASPERSRSREAMADVSQESS